MGKQLSPENLLIWAAFNKSLNSIPQDHNFKREEVGKQIPGFSEAMKTGFMIKLIKAGYLEKVRWSVYKRLKLIPEDLPYSDERGKIPVKKETVKDRDAEMKFIGKREGHELLEKLTKERVIDLVVGGEIKFEIKLVCSRVERNFQDQIISFSVDSVDVSIKNDDIKK